MKCELNIWLLYNILNAMDFDWCAVFDWITELQSFQWQQIVDNQLQKNNIIRCQVAVIMY